MNDLISRQAAIDAIDNLLEKPPYQVDCAYWGMALVNAEDAIFNLPSEQPDPRWIPVTKRLPERFGRFIVTIVPDAGELWETVDFAMYSDLMGLVKTPVFWQGNVGKSDFEDVTRKVIAWMPSPEVYREETEDAVH